MKGTNMPKHAAPPVQASWWQRRKLDTAIVGFLLIISFVISAVNMTGYPQRFEDEGTYISQAWAVQHKAALTHYTYWYDHPPLAWVQTAAYLALPGVAGRYDSDIIAGREFMLVIHVVSVILLYLLARRLRIGRAAAMICAIVYALSPLSVEFGRYVLLDNIAVPWLLGALLLALSPRRHIATAIGSAVCLAIAVLSKETFVVLLPVVIYALWKASDTRNRRYLITIFSMVFVMVSGFYVLYAALKNELFPGEGHVSLLGTLSWQLFGREGSGSIFDSSSNAYGLVKYWLSIDFWLLLGGVAALPFAFLYRNLRVAAFGLLIGLLLMLRTGYMPYPYIIALLPFAALVFAGVLHHAVIVPLQKRDHAMRTVLAGISAALLMAITVGFVMPAWQSKLSAIVSIDQDASSRQAIDWIQENIPLSSRIVVESALWTDLQNKGYSDPGPIWLYKTETDPAVTKQISGWQGIDYVALNGPTVGAASFGREFPTVSQAIRNAKLIKEFGRDNQKILIYQVQH